VHVTITPFVVTEERADRATNAWPVISILRPISVQIDVMSLAIAFRRLCLGVVVVFATGLAMPVPGQAQDFRTAEDLVAWSATAEPETAPVGTPVTIRLQASIAEGWKMYALDSPPPSRPSSVEITDVPDGLTLQGEVLQDPPETGYDPNFDADVRYFAREASFTASLQTDAAAPGTYDVGGTATYMICNDRMCLPPTRTSFSAAVTLTPAREAEGTPERSSTSSTPEAMADAPDAETASSPDSVTAAVSPASTPSGSESSDPSPAPEAERQSTSGSAKEGGVAAEGETVSPAVQDYERARADGFWGFLLLAIGAGLASLLMPCVFPMIPLTVSYFTKHADDRGEALRMASVYGGAIVLTFTGLGVLMAFLVGAAGAQTIAANPWVNLFIGLIFVVFALSLLGLFELRLPNGLLNYFNRQSNERSGYTGVLFMGFTLTLVSFSCTAPFVGGLLAATAVGQWTYPIFGMLIFSATFALPFFLFALFPRGLNSLPQSGSWMNTVKVVLGFIELAAALKFLSNADLVWGWGLLSRPLAIAICVVLFGLTGMYLIGKLRMKHEPQVQAIGVGRLLSAIGFFGLSLYMLPGLFGAPLNALDAYLPPRQAGDVSIVSSVRQASGGQGAAGASHGELDWFTDDIDGAFAAAQEQGKPVFIDFTGYTCTNCRQMEANVFPQPAVAERFEREFVLLRLYTDDLERGPTFQRFQFQMTGTVALPTYAIVHPEGRTLLTKTSGVLPERRFVAFLDEGASTFRQADGAPLAAAD
jgi:thiol:disulfide interchange protein DsbD